MSVWVISDYSGFLPQARDMQLIIGVSLNGDYKLPIGVKVTVNGCESLRIGAVTHG